MSGIDFARRELEILEKQAEADSPEGLEMQKYVTKCVIDLMEVFSKQGHSGLSASYVANLFDRLVQFKPLSPLTGEDDEWEPIGGGEYQNKRCPSVFKDADGHVHNSDYWYKKDEDTGLTYCDIDCFQGIHFPYIPEESKLLDLKETDDAYRAMELQYIKGIEDLNLRKKAEELSNKETKDEETTS